MKTQKERLDEIQKEFIDSGKTDEVYYEVPIIEEEIVEEQEDGEDVEQAEEIQEEQTDSLESMIEVVEKELNTIIEPQTFALYILKK